MDQPIAARTMTRPAAPALVPVLFMYQVPRRVSARAIVGVVVAGAKERGYLVRRGSLLGGSL
jgi:hypothetical protein